MAYKSKYRKPYRVKRKKSILRSRFFWPAVLAMLILAFLFYLLFLSPVFAIKNVEISGNKEIPIENIEKRILEQMSSGGDNILFLGADKIVNMLLETFPKISEVKLNTRLPGTLMVQIAEREPVAEFCLAENCFLLDAKGVIFEAASPAANLLRIESAEIIDAALGNTAVDEEKLAKILNIVAALKDSLGIAATQALLASKERLNIDTLEKWQIYFNLEGDIGWQIQELALVLEKEISPEERSKLEYIDLRFSRVYYKFR